MGEFRRSLEGAQLAGYTCRQLNTFFPDGDEATLARIRVAASEAETRLFDCFRRINKKYYREGEHVLFSHLHGDQYAAWLYLLGNTLAKVSGEHELAAKTFLLNKTLHGLDLYYGVELPALFLLVHPVGTVLGNARYGDCLVAYQNVNVGATEVGYPTFSGGTLLYGRSTVIGPCQVGEDVVFGAGSMVISRDVPPRTTVVGQHPGARFLANDRSVFERVFA